MRPARPSHPVSRRRFVPAAAVLITVALAVTACGGTEAPPTADIAPSGGTSSTPDPVPPSPSPTAEPTQPGQQPVINSLADRLVPAATVRSLWDRADLSEELPAPAATDPHGLCAPFDMMTIGADEVAASTLSPADESGEHVAQQAIEFVDDVTTKRVMAVLRSWPAECADLLDDPVTASKVSRLRLADPDTTAWRYWATTTPGGGMDGDRLHESYGVVARGRTMLVLTVRHAVPSGDELPTTDLLDQMLAAGAERLG